METQNRRSIATVSGQANRTRAGLYSAQSSIERQQYLLLREVAHRSINDMQMVASLLALQSRHAECEEARQALKDARDRVMVLANARAALMRNSHCTLDASLQQVCIALQSQAEPYGVTVCFASATLRSKLSAAQIIALTLAVNELATNALKHAFNGTDGGKISIAMHTDDDRNLTVTVADNGAPFSATSDRRGSGLGMNLVRRLVESANGLVIAPDEDSKTYEIRVPLDQQHLQVEV